MKIRMLMIGVAMFALIGAGQTPPTPGALDNVSLRTMLQGLGYELGSTSNQAYEISMKQGNSVFNPEVWISSSGRKIWIGLKIRMLGKGELDNPAELAGLLAANADVGPAQYYIENDSPDVAKPEWRLGYAYPVDNRAVTADVMQDALTAFLSGLVKESKVWQAPAATPPPPVGKS